MVDWFCHREMAEYRKKDSSVTDRRGKVYWVSSCHKAVIKLFLQNKFKYLPVGVSITSVVLFLYKQVCL